MIELGLTHTENFRVDRAMSADTYGNEGFHVLATPYLAAAFERCAVHALAPHLDSNSATVGIRLQIDHLAPTPIGAPVSIRCELTEIDKMRLTFHLEAVDPSGVVARCLHNRAIINREKFLRKVGALG